MLGPAFGIIDMLPAFFEFLCDFASLLVRGVYFTESRAAYS